MKRLLINTANDDLVITIENDGKLFSTILKSKMHHNETMLPEIDKLLKSQKLKLSDIDEYGVVIGPGSFTGIRVGIATIKAFRDATKKSAKGINNLDLLYELAKSQNEDIDVVAILGSRDSYFVARNVNGFLYKYDHNITHDELVKLSNGKQIGMYAKDESLNSFEVEFDEKIFLDCLIKSTDKTLTPIYYQLSQAEREKLKHGVIGIEQAKKEDLEKIVKIQKNSIKTNLFSKNLIENQLKNENSLIYVSKFNDEIVGYIILNLTDELNVESIAVDTEFRNLGIGTRLLEQAEIFAKSKGVETLSLEVAKSNITAYLLYEKFGFKIRRIRKKYYENGDDCIEMIKKID